MDDYQSSLPPRSERHSPKKNKNNKKRDHEDKQSSFMKDLLSTGTYIIALLLVFFVVQRYLYAPVMVDGDSMEPTLSDGNYLMLNKYSDIERFDIVVFPPPDDESDTLYIKRVIGVPGDQIEYYDEVLYLNGEEVDESYLPYTEEDEQASYTSGNFTLTTLLGVETVPEGHYFVLGDNRLNSRDSRTFGFIEEESILGKISLRYWPFEDFEVVNNDHSE